MKQGLTAPNHKQNSIILDLNKQMKNNQQRLGQIVKQADANHPSYHMNSKLYRPNSFLIANNHMNISLKTPNKPMGAKTQPNHLHVQTLPIKTNMKKAKELYKQQQLQQQQQQQLNVNTEFKPALKKYYMSSDQLNGTPKLASPNKTVQISPHTHARHEHKPNHRSNSPQKSVNNSNVKIPMTSKIKRKIFETITNKVSSNGHLNCSTNTLNNNHKHHQSIFSQSRLLQALQSQLNLFSSIRDTNNDQEVFHQRRANHNRTETTATFLSTSLERNSFRYASRRKYKTQSLVNPYRHANTNYPVYIHEALFMPEFSVKGEVRIYLVFIFLYN
jgi:hypothetical protein